MADADAPDRQQENREKTGVAVSSLLAASVLVLLKLIVGLLTNSLGILSEAAHSGLDLVAAGATLWAVRVSGRPATREYTYGRGKFENLSALFETVLLLATCLAIVYEAVQRLYFMQRIEVHVNVWAFLVVMLSMVVDFSRSRALRHYAEKYHSQALEADALHFSTDIWSSGVVLLGLGGAWVADHVGAPWLWLKSADTVAALGVAAIIIGVSLRLGKKSLDDLLDRVPMELHERVSAAAAAVPGVVQVTKVRLRRSGPQSFADVTLSVGQATSFEKAHEISDLAAAAVRAVLPRRRGGPRGAGGWGRGGIDDHGAAGGGPPRVWGPTACGSSTTRGSGIEFHLEVSGLLKPSRRRTGKPPSSSATSCAAVPGLSRIVSTRSRRGDAAATVRAEPAAQTQVRAALEDFYRRHGFPLDPHHIVAQQVGGELQVSFHCRLGAATALTEAHDLTVRLEEYLPQPDSQFGPRRDPRRAPQAARGGQRRHGLKWSGGKRSTGKAPRTQSGGFSVPFTGR